MSIVSEQLTAPPLTEIGRMGTVPKMPERHSELFLHRLATPVGEALLVTDERGALRALEFDDYAARMHKLLRIHYGEVQLREATVPAKLRDGLQGYFAREPGSLDAIECATNGTPFQVRVWRALRTIPHGSTTTYGSLARQFGVPNAARAVGLANGSNPIAIVVPCHRVVGANGQLTGYAGGLHRKRWLLDLERASEA